MLYSFKGLTSTDGANPYSTLVFNGLYAGRAFTLYGTTYNGGNPQTCPANGVVQGCGTVFELCAPSNYGGCGGVNTWKEKVLYRFLGGKDGAHPFAGLITDKASDSGRPSTAEGSEPASPAAARTNSAARFSS